MYVILANTVQWQKNLGVHPEVNLQIVASGLLYNTFTVCYGTIVFWRFLLLIVEYRVDFYITQIDTHGEYFALKISVLFGIKKTGFESSKE